MSWIFQGNPKYFDIDDYLSRYPTLIYWRTPKHDREIRLGDRAYIWRAGARAGLVAIGEIVELPVERSQVRFEEALSDHLWHEKRPNPSEKVVGIELDEIRLTEEEEMLSRSGALSDPVLSENAIIKAPQGTVFHLTPEQDARLSALWYRGASHNNEESTERDYVEGAISFKWHKRRERSSALRKKKLETFREHHGKLFCELCRLEPKRSYPDELAASVLEIHHTKPLSTARSPQPTSLEDLLVVCASCHRALHSSKDVEENTRRLREQFRHKYNNGFNTDAGKARAG